MISGLGQNKVLHNKQSGPCSIQSVQPQTQTVPVTQTTGEPAGTAYTSISDVRNQKPGKSNPLASQGVTGVQAELSGEVSGKKAGEGGGIKWSNSDNALSKEDMDYMQKNIGNIHSSISPDKVPQNLSIEFVKNAKLPLYDTKTGETAGSVNVDGVYKNKTNTIQISTFDIEGKNPLTREQIMDTAAHEYGHAVADTNVPDKSGGGDVYKRMTDSKGRDITDRANTLEQNAAKNNHKPGDIEVRPDRVHDLEQTTYDKHDPYVRSHAYRDLKGQVQEKYARESADEHYAETFKEYTRNPERFRSETAEMGEKLKTLTPGTEEYKYLKESLDIRKESYDYFKNNIFNGKEFS